MFEDLALNPATAKTLEAFCGGQAHGLILLAAKGAGKESLLKAVANRLGSARAESQIYYPKSSEAIGIAEIRRIKDRLRLKNRSNEVVAVVIPDAERLTREAENALLKLLEEPPANVRFLLSASQSNKLLPTVLSRLVPVSVLKPSPAELDGLSSRFTPKERQTAMRIADGWPGLYFRILNNQAGGLNESLSLARQILSSKPLERLQQIDSLAKQKEELPVLLFSLERLLHAGMHNAIDTGKPTSAWQSRLQAVVDAQEALEYSVTTKLALTRLMLGLS